jgi:thiol:disulfide interchange protein DsbA
MYLDFIKKFFFISLFFISISIVADDYRAGKHYQILAEPIATRDSEKIEVIEFFWFGCGHCYSLENQLNSWEKKLSSNVDFWRSPITWNEMAKTHAKLFYAAEFFNKPEIISNTFVSIHANQRMMTSDKELKPFFASFGVSEDKYQSLFNSFAMKNKIRRAETFGLKYEVRGVPAFIVNGKYKVSASRDVGTNELLDVVDYLINLERK